MLMLTHEKEEEECNRWRKQEGLKTGSGRVEEDIPSMINTPMDAANFGLPERLETKMLLLI